MAINNKQKKAAVDFAERVSATFIQAFLAVALVTGLSDRKSLEAAGVAGALAAGKFVYSKVQAYTSTEAVVVELPQVTEPPHGGPGGGATP